MKARDRVKLCIEQARNHSGETALRALTNAVEILADQLKDEHVGTYRPPMIAEIKTQDDPEVGAHDPAPNATPEPNLVERLKKAYVFAEMEAIAGGGDPVDMGVRAILAELAKMPLAMMTADHIATLCGGEDYSPTDRRYARVAVQAFKEFIAPILAAKDARIEKLEALCAAVKVTDPERIETIELQRKRIVELEKQRDDERGLSNLRAHEIDTWKTRLAGAREMIADLERRREAEAEFPTDDDIANRVDTPNDCCIDSVLQAIAICREHHAAVVAAKDAKIAELGKQLATARADIEAHVTQARCAAVNLGYPDRTLEDAVRAVEQQKILDGIAAKEAEREQRACVEALSESLLVMPGRTLVDAVKDLIKLHGTTKKKLDELEKRLTERDAQYETLLRCKDAMGIHREAFCDLPARIALLKANSVPPMTVDGKTPGQVNHDVWLAADEEANTLEKMDACWDIAALAVLRAFGQPSQTPTNAADALRDCLEMVRERLGEEERSVGGEHLAVDRPTWTKIINEEIAKLSAEPPRDATTPKFFANENELRGSYFCTAISLHPYLHVGHDVEFDDIPRILKLGRNDVIEVRVVHRERAKTA